MPPSILSCLWLLRVCPVGLGLFSFLSSYFTAQSLCMCSFPWQESANIFLLNHKIPLQLVGKYFAAAAAASLQSCSILCDPIDGSPPGSPVPGILQARILEWVAISFSSAWKWKVKVKSLSRVRLVGTPCTAAYQAPPSMGFSSKSAGVGCHRLLRLATFKNQN